MMANSHDGKHYPQSSIEHLSGKDQSRGLVLNLGNKLDPFPSDQTPTPIRLIKKCEEMGVFQDLINPFEETFRRAAEDIRSGTTPLEMSSLSVPNNSDDSLHTPHVIFPNPNEVIRRRRPISPREFSSPIIQHDTDPLNMCLDESDDDNDDDKLVVQQEADTSEDAQTSNLNVSDINDEAAYGQIQFLLRMPNGKMVQLSSLPVEQMDSVTNGAKEKDIPVIKVDSSFLKNAGDDNSRLGSTSNVPTSGGISANKIKGNSVVNPCSSKDADRSSNSVNSKKNNILNRMSIAKQKLKQALMNNSCPATNSKSSPGVISSSETNSNTSGRVSSPELEPLHMEAKSGSSIDDTPLEMNWMEEKRKRNRAAAMRCREKRKTWVKELERRANDMLRTNGQLQHEVSMLRDEVAQLKTLLLAHRDCPVTQAMVQGKSALPAGTNLTAPVSKTSSAATKLKSSKGVGSPSTIVIQTPAAPNNVKPRILLNDPPAKRKRLNSSTSSSSTNSPAASVSVVSSPPSSSSLHTLVLPSKSSTVLNHGYVIPSVLVANPTTSTSTSLGTSHVIYSQFVPCLPTIAPNPVPNVATPRQAYILPKGKANPVSSGNGYAKVIRPEGKAHTTLLSTNVIKVNPNVMDRDNNDSDIEILDVK